MRAEERPLLLDAEALARVIAKHRPRKWPNGDLSCWCGRVFYSTETWATHVADQALFDAVRRYDQ